jgi:hypothetical protein
MRYLSSRPFLVGLLLVAGAILSTPLFVTALAGNCSPPSPGPDSPSSWDCFQPYIFDFRVPMSIAVSGVALMLVSVVRIRRAN